MGERYYLSKDNLSRIADALNAALEDAKNEETGAETTVASLDHAQREIEDICPASWYPARDNIFDEVRDAVRADPKDSAQAIEEFHLDIIERLYDDFEIEP